MSISLIGHANHHAINGLSNAIAYTGHIGNSVIVMISMNSSGSSTCTISDTAANNWQTIKPITRAGSGGNSNYIAAFYAQNWNTSSSSTITVSWTTNNNVSTVMVAEYSGLGAFDVASTVAGNSTINTTMTSNSVSPSQNGELGIVFACTATANVTFSAWGNSYTQEDSYVNASLGPSTAWAGLVLSGIGATNSFATCSASVFWGSVVLLFKPGAISNVDASTASISGNGPGIVTANSACAPGDLILCQFSLSNVAVENATFIPTVSDNVNSGNYTITGAQYSAGSSTIRGLAWIVANASGTPQVTLAGSVNYNNGFLNYVRWLGFSATPSLDTIVTATGNSTTPSASLTTNSNNELVAGLTWGGNSYSSGPVGWNFVSGASQGDNISPYWLEATSPTTSTFSGTLSTSEPWVLTLVGFSSGPAQQAIGVIRLPGGGPNPHRIQTFIPRALSTTSPSGFNAAFGGSVAGGYAHGVPQGIVGGYGGSVAGGYALGQAFQAFMGRQTLRGPGPSPDWQTTFVPRALATLSPTTPFGVTSAYGGSVAGGFANPMQLGIGAAVGGSVAGGYAISGSISTGAAFGGSVAGGFARFIVVSAIGGSVAGGYASPALFNFISLGEAIEILANAGFTVNPIIIWQYSTAVPYYYIIGQLPTAGTVIPYQSQPVQLTVSAGPPPPVPPLITVPNVTGLPLTYAIQALGLSMLNIGTISYIQSSTTPPNQVTSQAPSAGNSVEQYTGVSLIVCSGPVMDTLIGDPYTVPNVSS